MSDEEKAPDRPRELISGIDLIYVLLMLWDRKKWIALGTALVTLAGLLYALLATPLYFSKATIALKQQETGGVSMAFAQLSGMVGGGVGGGYAINKIEILLKGQELAEQVIRENDQLLPALFPERWDAAARNWKDPKKKPTLRRGASKLKGQILQIKVKAKQGVIEVGARSPDSLLAKKVVDYYLVALNNRIRGDVTLAAESDRRYLETQLANTFDPMLTVKIQAMVAYQVERAMLVSSRAFEVLEQPVVPQSPESPQRQKVVVLSFLFGLFFSVTGVFVWQACLKLRRALIRGRVAQLRQ
jgi:uncharacterized protein involved in exopolysaccharide biosynthesis